MHHSTPWIVAASIFCVGANSSAQPATVTILHSFSGADGSSPGPAPLIRVGPAELWGVTQSGGLWGHGSIFRMTRDGAFTPVYSFLGLGDGAYPLGLVLGPDGAVYGTTVGFSGGTFGTFFRIAPSGAMTTLFVFRNSSVGEQPGPLMVTRDGAIFGMTSAGGPSGFGTVFRADSTGSMTVVHAFSAEDRPGYLNDPIVEAVDGSLWGGTGAIPPGGGGFVFKLTRTGEFVRFPVPGFGLFTWMTRLVAARDGSLYGTRHNEGFPGHNDWMAHISAAGAITVDSKPLPDVRFWAEGQDGTLFATAGDQILRVAHDFTYTFVASMPESYGFTVVDGLDGYLYGTAASGGAFGRGTVFSAPQQIKAQRGVGNDFDGDRRADPAVYRPSAGSIFAGGHQTLFFQTSGVVPVPADYDGDGRTDAALFYPWGEWRIVSNQFGIFSDFIFGAPGDIPVPADFDGDLHADIAVYRPSTGHWYNANPAFDADWGLPGDVPVPADYDGDGKADVAVYRPSTGTWWILPSSTHAPAAYFWGTSGDVPVPADYDGDGKCDIAMYRPSTGQWFILTSSSNFTTSVAYQWGVAADTPVPADFDGDGKADLAVFLSSGLWLIANSSSGYTTWTSLTFGGGGDIPLAPMPHQNVP